MKVKKIILKQFKRFDDLTIDLGDKPSKIIALVGPNGCGKSSIFDAFEEKLKDIRNFGQEEVHYYSKSLYSSDIEKRKHQYNKHNAIQIFTDLPNNQLLRNSFYIRTAYRFSSKFNVQDIKAMPSVFEHRDEPISTISLDTRLESNYKRLLGMAYSEFFIGIKTGEQVKNELIGDINRILIKILDIEISDLGNILEKKGQLYFKKGNSLNFPYANLSSGEKEVIDIIMDLIIKSKQYDNTVICIDEPELHLNTSIQRKLLIEIEKLIPETCQLWVATHSIGFLRAIQDELKSKSQIIDFSEGDFFTGTHTINPIQFSRKNWQRIFSTALDDLTHLISPRKIIYCEGNEKKSKDGNDLGFDADVYNTIFSNKYTDTIFVSSGGNTELDKRSDIAISILNKVFKDLEILVLKDRDLASGKIATEKDRNLYLESNPANHRVLKRFEIENYLFDKEVLMKYSEGNGLNFDEFTYDQKITDILNDNVKDQLSVIKNICGIKTSINAEVFKKSLAKLITEDSNIFKELEECIFQ
ncbi:AAA family ATPase [Leptospira sp. 201903075]|uniref:AAA family ATPase n=1 Tax=Leptospira chreensis TaxID=2810035 RepID=UPI00196247C8|nr:AAA family ATPase [Leptospira chreensis]MBM9589727.1 AAA family ATPase [Leptospira chreensis]